MTKLRSNILVIEDDLALNQAYYTILQTAGYAVRTAFDGKQALQLIKEDDPDIIFLDLRMPTLDGVGFLKAYKPKEQHQHVEIIVFSNYDVQQEIDEAYRLGARRYVLKAWASPMELIRIVEDVIASRAM